ncbi:MAG: tetratricopeptide repeat protein [Pseudomonadota bacterium]
MANDETIFREVDQDLAEENLWRDIEKRGPWLLGLGALVVAFVAGNQIFTSQQNAAREKGARSFQELTKTIEESPDDAIAAVELYADEAPTGYEALARFQLASAYAREDEPGKARAAYQAIYGNRALPEAVINLARLRAGYLALDMDRSAVIDDVGSLESLDGAYGAYAREILGLAALKAGDFENASAQFQSLLVSTATPPALRARAEEFLAQALTAKSGIDIAPPVGPGRTAVDSIMNALEQSGGGLGDFLQGQQADDGTVSEEAPGANGGANGDGDASSSITLGADNAAVESDGSAGDTAGAADAAVPADNKTNTNADADSDAGPQASEPETSEPEKSESATSEDDQSADTAEVPEEGDE